MWIIYTIDIYKYLIFYVFGKCKAAVCCLPHPGCSMLFWHFRSIYCFFMPIKSYSFSDKPIKFAIKSIKNKVYSKTLADLLEKLKHWLKLSLK